MCGIIGIWGEEALRDYHNKLKLGWERLAHRGEDSYGVIIKTPEEIISYKSLSQEALLQKLTEEEKKGEFKREQVEWILAHNRKASIGGINVELAHPIYYKEEKALIIHNGTKKSLANAFGTDSDTQALAYVFTLARKEAKVRLLDGVGVAFAVKRGIKGYHLYFHKDEERPLVCNPQLGIVASEPFLEGEWFEINNIPYKELKHLKDLENLIVPNKSESVVIKKCRLCGKEFIGSKEEYCRDCLKLKSTTYYDSSYSQSSYGKYSWNSTAKSKKK